jgi:hypothetical protein
MKSKFFNIKIGVVLLLSAGIITSSCKKYLSPEPLSTFDPSVAFGSLVNAKASLMGAYLSMAGDYGYGIRASVYYPYDTDEILGGGAGLDQSRHQIAHYTLQAGNADIVNSFNQFYAGIERANQCIYYIPRMAQYLSGTATDQAELKRMVGEALVLRAQYYYEIIRNWGDVPAQWLPSAVVPDLFIPRTDRDTIYNRLLNDLVTAKGFLPWRTAVTQDERFTKGTAMALRAKIALARGGYSLRMNGNLERRADYLTYYTIARDECSELMGRRDQHTLLPTYVSIWKDNIDAHKALDAAGEIIMQAAMANGTNSDSKLGLQNGTKINGVGGALGQVLPTYFYQFDSTDVRRDVTCVPFEIIQDVYGKGHGTNSIYDGKFRRDWVSNPSFYFSAGPSSTVPAITLTSASNSALQNMQLNWPMIRFADVLLMFAEADNEISTTGPTTAAINAWKEVSLRGHNNNAALVPALPAILDKEGFFKLLVRERLLEFGGEGIRKYDLIRWNKLGTALAETKANLVALAAGTAMAAPSYMAAPPAYTLTATLPQYMYFYTYRRVAGDSATQMAKMWAGSFYQPSPSVVPKDSSIAGYPTFPTANRVNWAKSANITTSLVNYIAYGFTTGKSELFPIPTATLDANPALLNKNNPLY